MSRVIVTGGAGRLGRSIVSALAADGHEVVGVDRAEAPRFPGELVAHDLTDAQATRDLFARIAPDAVIHLAAVSVPFRLPDADTFAINTSLAFSVLEATLACGAGSLLVASSPTVIGYNSPGGWEPRSLPIDEDHPLAPWNGYSLSKLAVEEIVAMAVRAHGDRLHLGLFRPCYVIAPEEWEGAPTQQGHTVRERLARPELSAVALFNYVDARDVGGFVSRWVERAEELRNGSCFFVGADDSLVREPVAEALARFVPETSSLASALAPDAAVFSSARAKDLLGWRPAYRWRDLVREEPPAPHAANAMTTERADA